MKVKNEKTQEGQAEQTANPIEDILASKRQGRLCLSPQDLEVLQNIANNPPPPTSELVRAVEEYKQSVNSKRQITKVTAS